MSSKRILHVTSELSPYLPENPISTTVNNLAVKSYSAGNDVRVFMPRFGFINERRFQLHEVIRLSGINLIINDLDQPLVIKVASLPGERMQVYFVDNEEYFKRKSLYEDESGNFHEDNHERAVFFVKGVLETIKKLNWVPDVIHVHGWMAAFLPIYLKTYYSKDTMFSECKIVTSVYNSMNDYSLPNDVYDVLDFDKIEKSSFTYFTAPKTNNLVVESLQYSDLVLKGEEFVGDDMKKFLEENPSKMDYDSLEDLADIYADFIREGVNLS
ncbi:MAG: glycogen/starch synthase [Flavobacteriales bacterium]|nr:glycogen/starch synthase [Flavobacteriales bacterium]